MCNNKFWELCPKCNGLGVMNSHTSDYKTQYTCNVCQGKMIISTFTGLPPQASIDINTPKDSIDINTPKDSNGNDLMLFNT